MKRILITGGAGFLGAHVARQLVALGHKVLSLDSFAHYRTPEDASYFYHVEKRMAWLKDSVEMACCNTACFEQVLQVFERFKPDVVIHLAAMPLANVALEQPEEATSSIVNGTLNVLKASHRLGVDRFLYASSSMVYGDFVQTPVSEDHPKSPKEVYGSLKYAGETIVQAYSKLWGMEYTIVRPSAVYGPTDNNKRVLAIFLDRALNGQPLVVKGADKRLDFTFVEDTSRGIVLAATHPGGKDETFNITRGNSQRILDAAKIIQKYIPEVEIQATEPESWSPARGTLDISKAREILGYEPKYDLEKGLEVYLEYLLQMRKDLLSGPSYRPGPNLEGLLA